MGVVVVDCIILFHVLRRVCVVIEAGQMTQSAHFACQLPYVMFGLGPTPNYVEKVKVGIPNYVGNQVQSQF